MRIAIPKGRLFAEVIELLRGIGFKFDLEERNYKIDFHSPAGTTGRIVKPRAIPQLLALDSFDIGFCGLDLIREAGYKECVSLLDLQTSKVDIVVAVAPKDKDILTVPPKRPVVIATEYVHLADEWAMRRNLAHVTIQTWGSTEGYAPELADIVFDCRETGKTIAANSLVVIDEIMKSSTVLAVNEQALAKDEKIYQQLVSSIHEFWRKGGKP